jgi:hypothetical protein
MERRPSPRGRGDIRLVMKLFAAFVVGGLGAFILGISRDRPSHSPEDQSLAQEALRLGSENRSLALELALASLEQPYLLLDESGQTITLKSHGAPLREFRALRTSVPDRHRERSFFWKVPDPDTVWTGGTLLPAKKKVRVVILSDSVSAPDPSGTMSFIPPSPEEATPGPPTFRIRFQGGLSLFVTSDGDGPSPDLGVGQGGAGSPSPASAPGVFQRLTLWVGLKPWKRDPLRLEVVLPPDEAGSLYRAFSDGASLLVNRPFSGEGRSGDRSL